MTQITFVRHGQTDWNLQRRIQGLTDIPLNDTGRAQARRTGEQLALDSWDAIVSSPLSRARETAEIIARHVGLPSPDLIDGLQERAHGDMEGMSFEERQAAFPGDTVVPGLESRDAVIDRVLAALGGLERTHPFERIIAVTHGGVIGSLVRHATQGGQPAAGQVIANGSHHDFSWSGGSLALLTLRAAETDKDLPPSKIPQR
ncbi:histidine phosphatase family protein [Paramicrobacterium agarici]|uniref:Putative phosphoglycerate mutase/uncharacterized phosphatase n=1 Tax=Paramicrobacterium agarici TaxID=630514 RepID=A0A2A9DXT5_9MICO|nr:histidine phosphatase family protein [Microbacterium agarici]PFG31394.1 putative phosphoglycerate mutase/uncharacterized phosphatase [Microbacterium agarici]